MTMNLSPATITRLEKDAVDDGFDRDLPREGDWLASASTRAPMRLWLAVFDAAVLIAAFSQPHGARALGEYGTPIAAPLPAGVVVGRTVVDVPTLQRLVRRAFQPSMTRSDEPPGTEERAILPLRGAARVNGIVGAHRGNLTWQRARVFEKSGAFAT